MSRQEPGLIIQLTLYGVCYWEQRGGNTDAEIWPLTESLIELPAYKVKTHTECPLFESGQLSVGKSDKVNELFGLVCVFNKAQKSSRRTCIHLDGQALVDVNEGR